MFTGIITDIGTVALEEKTEGGKRLRISCAYDMASVALGASIACDGVCLAVIEKGDDWFDVDVSQETLSLTNIAVWEKGQRINLERALCVGDELGGHIVTGHVDGLVEVVDVEKKGDIYCLTLKMTKDIAPFVARKGSVTLQGASLTVNDVQGDEFAVNIIPHTWEVTTLSQSEAGNHLHVEIDTISRYTARLLVYQG